MKRTYASALKTAGLLFGLIGIASSCSVEFSIKQPGTTEQDSSFAVQLYFQEFPYMGITYPAEGQHIFGIQLPLGWTVEDSIAIYDSSITPSSVPISQIIYSQGLADSMNIFHPSDPGRYWWVGNWSIPNNIAFGAVSIDPTDTTGSFLIDYFGGTDLLNYDDYVIVRNTNITVGLPDTQYVTSNQDSGPGSLRWAVEHTANDGVVLFGLTGEDTILLTESIKVYSGLTIDGGPNMPVISGNDSCTVFVIDGYNNTPTLKNLIITRGKGIHGGGIRCGGFSGLILSNVKLIDNRAEEGAGLFADFNLDKWKLTALDIQKMLSLNEVVISDCYATGFGGGIYSSNGKLSLNDVVIRNNYATYAGGGVYCSYNGELKINGGIIANNRADMWGGGVCVFSNSVNITNSLIIGNSSKNAGGILSNYCEPLSLINNTIAGNIADSTSAGGLDFGDRQYYSGPYGKMENNILWGNFNAQGPASLGIGTPSASSGAKLTLSHCNFPANSIIGNLPVITNGCCYSPPLFDSLSAYHPYSLLPASPCIEAGIYPTDPLFPTTDIVGNPRVQDGDNDGVSVIDIGAYEYDAIWAGLGERPGKIAERLDVRIFPNPARNQVNVEVTTHRSGRVSMSLYSLNGRMAGTWEALQAANFQTTTTIDLSRFKPGLYMLEVIAGDDIAHKKLVVY
ncbi:MAG TPA: T9SS type A sorting domain-containing protein [Bacteroidales bacterium]|nr:T9SS type A sorting domain-containing protein [Bacteroidales bacterium]